MVEKGLGREDLAIAVLIDFPFQIFGGWIAARWSRGDKPLRPWLWAFWPRLGFALVATMIVYWFPAPPISTGFFTFLVIHTVLSSFSSYVTCQIVSQLWLTQGHCQNRSICWVVSVPRQDIRSCDWRDIYDLAQHVYKSWWHLAEVFCSQRYVSFATSRSLTRPKLSYVPDRRGFFHRSYMQCYRCRFGSYYTKYVYTLRVWNVY